MKDKFLKKRKKYTVALLAATAATVATSFSPSAPGVMASGNGADVANDIPDSFNPPTYTEVPFDPDAVNLNIPYYHVEAGKNVSVTTNTFVADDSTGNVHATFNNFVVTANDTIIEDSGDIVVDTGDSENAEKGEENGVTRKYKLKLSDSLKEELKNAAAGGGGGADPSVKSVVSGDEDKLTVTNNNGDITVTPVVAADITDGGDANKLATAGVVNTAITNAVDPLADKNLSNITDDGKKVITGLGTEVVQGDGVTVTSEEDATTGKKTYTISATKPNFASGDEDKLTVTNNNGDITVTPVVAADITDAGDANKLATAGVVNTAITNAVDPLADKNLSNITDDGKKVITGLGTEVVQGDGVTVTSEEDATTGKKTYTISATKPNFASGDEDKLTVTNNNGDITVTPVVAADITDAGDANKLATAGVVNTAITNATAPLADKNLSNITDAGKKVITGLGTEVVQGDGVTVTSDVDATTGKKTYTISAVKPSFAAGSNTTVVGDGTATPYKVNLNSELTGITSITGDTLTLHGGATTVAISDNGVDVGGKKITNLKEGDVSENSTDAVTGKQLHATNTKVANLEANKLDKTDDVHVQAGKYSVAEDGTVTLPLVKGEADTATGKNVVIDGIVTKAVLSAEVDKHDLNIAGDENSQHTTKLKDGISIKGSSNFTPKEAGINIQAIATDKGFEVKLSENLTNMKGITFAPTTQGGASVSLTSTGLDNGGNTITNVAAGVNDTDAVNVSQLKGLANATVNVDSRINRLGAQSAAMAGLRHLQYDPLEPTTLMAGVGTYKGQTALALGIAHYKNESLLFHVGASIGSKHDELMANAGVSWKFGARADETAVKDAYRQGPISASYTLQDKVSALEVQNQMQKDEINELKAQLAEVLQYIKKG